MKKDFYFTNESGEIEIDFKELAVQTNDIFSNSVSKNILDEQYIKAIDFFNFNDDMKKLNILMSSDMLFFYTYLGEETNYRFSCIHKSEIEALGFKEVSQ